MHSFAGLPTQQRSVPIVKALRSCIELAMAHPTTLADSEKHVVVSLEAEEKVQLMETLCRS